MQLWRNLFLRLFDMCTNFPRTIACKIHFRYEIGIVVFQPLPFCVEIKFPGTTHIVTQCNFIECHCENVQFVFGVGEVDIFYFSFATCIWKKKKKTQLLVQDNFVTLNLEVKFDVINIYKL